MNFFHCIKDQNRAFVFKITITLHHQVCDRQSNCAFAKTLQRSQAEMGCHLGLADSEAHGSRGALVAVLVVVRLTENPIAGIRV